MKDIILTYFDFFQNLFSTFFGDFLVALIILLIGLLIGRIVEKFTSKFLRTLDLDGLIGKAAGLKFSLESFISHAISYGVYFIAIVMTLGKLGIATTVLHIIVAGGVVFLVIAILLSVKDFIPNFVGGIVIFRKKLFKVGDYIEINGIEGKIVHISFLETQIKDKNKDVIYLPNSVVMKNKLLVKDFPK